VLTDSAIEIKEKVMFETGSSDILAESHGLLNEVAAILKDNPQIKVINIEGHTDSVGSDRKNKQLSEQRAASVALFLAGAGVDAQRMVPQGHGEEKPIADNETEEGRDANRRVEFNIAKQADDETKTEEEG
jgi:OOP family OmpA-OmpF porin